ncbi:aldose 1-epimerase [Acidisoma cellulosilytica]|uniref:Aldose 1-epimerase n=1 Tax=Acidisoma cellulosilyticum TaxID=2802395 RepID=A0A963Z706_9PROT|nr:aldose 1-epimerase [Acidisoma cellulosilyticum]MCB8883753.1 aldose 1-epimerase [Acidisoma cellulosilyticum]
MTGDRFTLSQGPLAVDLDRRGAVICGFRWTGPAGVTQHLMRDARHHDGDPLKASCFPLLPFCNRVRDNRFQLHGRDYYLQPNQPWDRHYLHGDGWLNDWQVLDLGSDTIRFALRRKANAQSPYNYEAEIVYRLSVAPQPTLAVALSIRNLANETMPFGLGLHPYFPLTPMMTLRARASGFFSEEAEFMPGPLTAIPPDLDFAERRSPPRHWINNGFKGWNGKAEIIWPEHDLGLHIDADPAFQDFFVFMSDTAFEPDFAGDYFCFEPMTHEADAHHAADLGGLKLLAPGETLNAAVRFTPQPLRNRSPS